MTAEAGQMEPDKKSDDTLVIDNDEINQLMLKLSDRLTPTELVDILGVSTEEVFEAFLDQCIEIDWDVILE